MGKMAENGGFRRLLDRTSVSEFECIIMGEYKNITRRALCVFLPLGRHTFVNIDF
jgi:hypothetical protein